MRGLEVQLYRYPHKNTMLFNHTSKIIRQSRTNYKVCNRVDFFALSMLRSISIQEKNFVSTVSMKHTSLRILARNDAIFATSGHFDL